MRFLIFHIVCCAMQRMSKRPVLGSTECAFPGLGAPAIPLSFLSPPHPLLPSSPPPPATSAMKNYSTRATISSQHINRRSLPRGLSRTLRPPPLVAHCVPPFSLATFQSHLRGPTRSHLVATRRYSRGSTRAIAELGTSAEPSHYPGPSAVAMTPNAGRVSRVGLAALVAGVVAISFLATLASAQVAKCDRDCGDSADCYFRDDGTLGCACVNEEFDFYEPDKTCFGPKLQTTVQLLWPKAKARTELTFPISMPAEQLTSSITCINVSSTAAGSAKVTVVWDDASVEAAGMGMCRSLTGYSGPDCSGHPGLAIDRPANKGRSYPVTKRAVRASESPRSIGCEITTCHKECGAAECVVNWGQSQCQCPEGLVFNAAKKLCLVPPPPKCKPACTSNAQCTWVGGKSVCQCKQGFQMVKNKST
ncbi:unnamed protein product, partial [Closterium sp. Yama58-4]